MTYRPLGVSLIGAYYLFLAAIATLVSVLLLAGVHPDARGVIDLPANVTIQLQVPPWAVWNWRIVGICFLLLGAMAAALWHGMANLQRWARMATVVFAALFALRGLLVLYDALAPFERQRALAAAASLLLHGWIVGYLFKPGVRRAFSGQ